MVVEEMTNYLHEKEYFSPDFSAQNSLEYENNEHKLFLTGINEGAKNLSRSITDDFIKINR